MNMYFTITCTQYTPRSAGPRPRGSRSCPHATLLGLYPLSEPKRHPDNQCPEQLLTPTRTPEGRRETERGRKIGGKWEKGIPSGEEVPRQGEDRASRAVRLTAATRVPVVRPAHPQVLSAPLGPNSAGGMMAEVECSLNWDIC